jgi:hypothetical protein
MYQDPEWEGQPKPQRVKREPTALASSYPQYENHMAASPVARRLCRSLREVSSSPQDERYPNDGRPAVARIAEVAWSQTEKPETRALPREIEKDGSRPERRHQEEECSGPLLEWEGVSSKKEAGEKTKRPLERVVQGSGSETHERDHPQETHPGCLRERNLNRRRVYADHLKSWRHQASGIEESKDSQPPDPERYGLPESGRQARCEYSDLLSTVEESS